MRKKFRVWIFIPLVLAVSLACTPEDKGVEARYLRDDGLSCSPTRVCRLSDIENYLQLRSDGSFVTHEDGLTVAGTYRIDGNAITLILPTGVASVGTISGEDNALITDDENQRWFKQDTLYNRQLQVASSTTTNFTENDSTPEWVVQPIAFQVFLHCPGLGHERFAGFTPPNDMGTIGSFTSYIEARTKTVPFPGQEPRKPLIAVSLRVLPDAISADMAYSCLISEELGSNRKKTVDEEGVVGGQSRVFGIELREDLPLEYRLYFIEGNTVARVGGVAGTPKEDVIEWAKRLETKIKKVQTSP